MLFDSEGNVALDRTSGLGYNTLLLRLIPGDLLSASPLGQFHTLPGLLDSRVALLNSYPNKCAYACSQFVQFLWWSLVWPGRDANPWPTMWEADMLTTKPTWHSMFSTKETCLVSIWFPPTWSDSGDTSFSLGAHDQEGLKKRFCSTLHATMHTVYFLKAWHFRVKKSKSEIWLIL